MRIYFPLQRLAPTKSSPFKLFFGLMALIGTLFAVSGIGAACRSAHIRDSYKLTTAIVAGFVPSGESTSTLLEFTVDGTLYQVKSGSYSSGWKVGSRLAVYYNPANPMQAHERSTLNLIPILFVSVGTCLAGVGGIGLWRLSVGARSIETLVESGQRLYGTVVGYEQNTRLSMNHRHPFRLEVECRDFDGTTRSFVSGHVWQDVDDSVLDRQIVIYLDRENRDRYFVDANALF